MLVGFSALQRAEIAEILKRVYLLEGMLICFSALQRAEIAEIVLPQAVCGLAAAVSVLFNEPKLLKCTNSNRSYAPL